MNEFLRNYGQEKEALKEVGQAVVYYYMPDIDRQYLKRAEIEGFPDEATVEGVITASRTATEVKLNGIGMSIPLYLETLTLLREGGVDWLNEVSKYTQEFTEGVEKTVQTTKDQFSEDGLYSDERQELHDQIIREKFEGLIPVNSPKIIFVLGVPGSGKSEAVREFLEMNENFMLSDLDSQRGRLLPGFDGTKLTDVLATQDEMVDIAYEALDIAFANNINIICETTLRGEVWLNFMLDFARGYKKEFVLVHSKLEECFKRAVAYRDRPISLDFMLRAFRDGYANLFRVASANPDFNIRIFDNSGNSFIDAMQVYQRIDGIAETKDPGVVADILADMNKWKEVK